MAVQCATLHASIFTADTYNTLAWPTGTTPGTEKSLKLHGKRGRRAYKKAGSHNAGQGAGEEVATQAGPCKEGHCSQNRHIAGQLVAAQVQVLHQHIPWH